MKTKNNLFPGAIFQNSDGRIGKIITIDARRASIKLHQGGFVMVDFFDKLSPVPLTHDILGMLGFAGERVHGDEDQTVYEHSPTTPDIFHRTGGDFELVAKYRSESFGSIQYVHQLQQIYLALHQILLEIK